MIFRVGTVGAPSGERTIINRESFDGSLLRASYILGSYPDLKGFTVPYCDVDYVAGFTCSNKTLAPPRGTPPAILNVVQENYHFTSLCRSCMGGISVSVLSPELWYDKLKAYCQTHSGDELCQRLFLVLQQRPWPCLSPIPDYFLYINNMPVIHYPVGGVHPSTSLQDADPSKTSIEKYILLHTGQLEGSYSYSSSSRSK